MKWGVTKVKHPNKGHTPNKGQEPMYTCTKVSVIRRVHCIPLLVSCVFGASLVPRPFEEEEKGPGTHCTRMREVCGTFSSNNSPDIVATTRSDVYGQCTLYTKHPMASEVIEAYRLDVSFDFK